MDNFFGFVIGTRGISWPIFSRLGDFNSIPLGLTQK